MKTKDYCFTVYDNDGNELINTWLPQEAYEVAKLYEEANYFSREPKEAFIEVGIYENGSISGTETIDTYDLESRFEVYEPLELHTIGKYQINENTVTVNGKEYPYEMCVSSSVPDDMCMKVEIDGKNYYFG